jgi:hypothetical protein
MRISRVCVVNRRVMYGAGVVVLALSVGVLAGTKKASASQKKSAPARSAPAKSAPKATAKSSGSAGGTKSAGGSSRSGGGSGTNKSTSSTKGPVGTSRKVAGGGTVKTTSKGEVTKGPNGHVQSVKLNNGREAKFGSNGRVKEVHAESRGGGRMVVSHGPGGMRRTEIERPDHSRLVAEGHGRGYIEHRYQYGGHAYYARGYYSHGGYYRNYYHPYYYGGVQLYGYAPAYYYPTAYYGWAYNPWPTPAPYAWGWGAAPWYGYYGAYFAPYPVYRSPAFWLTDYLIAATLTAAYENAAANSAGLYPNGNPTADGGSNILLASYTPSGDHGPSEGWNGGDPWAWAGAGAGVTLTPEIKKQISDEIQDDLAAQKAEKAASEDAPSVGTLGTLLADGKPHIFVAGSPITVSSGGEDCSITDGDVLSLPAAPPKDSESANLTVLASKKADCTENSSVAIKLTDVQDMQNHLLASIDKGMGEMKDNGAKGGLPAPPADVTAGSKEAPYAAAAPPPDKDGAAELDAAATEGAQTEAQVVAEADAADDSGATTASAGTAAGTAVAAAPPPAKMQTISSGQTIAQVVAMKGQPKQVLNFASKTIYVYPDMKITFVKGKLTDAE